MVASVIPDSRGRVQGFSLIELMIVVSIIGILAAIAIPQYQDYATRSRWSSVLSAVASLKTEVARCLQERAGELLKCNDLAQVGVADVPSPSAMYGAVVSIVASGTPAAIQIDGSGQTGLGNCVVTMIPEPDGANFRWQLVNSGAAGCVRARTGVGT